MSKKFLTQTHFKYWINCSSSHSYYHTEWNIPYRYPKICSLKQIKQIIMSIAKSSIIQPPCIFLIQTRSKPVNHWAYISISKVKKNHANYPPVTEITCRWSANICRTVAGKKIPWWHPTSLIPIRGEVNSGKLCMVQVYCIHNLRKLFAMIQGW